MTSAKKKTPRKAASKKQRDGMDGPRLHDPALQKPLLALHAATNSESFLKAATQFIQAVIPCDRVLVLLHYPYQYGRSTIVRGSDGTTLDEKYVRGSYKNNPFLPIVAGNPGMKIHRYTDMYASAAEMAKCHFYKNFMKDRDAYYACTLMFWNENLDSVDCALTPERGRHGKNFTDEEMATLHLMHAHIEAVYRRVNQIQNELSARDSLRDLLGRLPLPTILLDWKLKPVYHNPAAREACSQWQGDPHVKQPAHAVRIPADITREMEAMRDEWSMALRKNPLSTKFWSRTIQHPGIPGLRALLEMTTLRSPHFGKPSFLLRFEQEKPARGKSLATLVRLTPAERKLAELVCEGRSNQEIADSLGRSLSTVKSGLYGVFKKLNVTSRTKLLKLLR